MAGKRKKKTTPAATVEPEQAPAAPDPADPATTLEALGRDAVIARQTCRVTIEGNRDVRLYKGDIFRLPMARILWRDAREFVEPWPKAEK